MFLLFTLLGLGIDRGRGSIPSGRPYMTAEEITTFGPRDVGRVIPGRDLGAATGVGSDTQILLAPIMHRPHEHLWPMACCLHRIR
ncbi:MAG: hypothetical protein SGJ20_06435, partial [Planctomycetota bacterium]|nr:hypothetical protein [Planctomycetota bacterium]